MYEIKNISCENYTMKKIVVITGAGTGVGYQVSLSLLEGNNEIHVVAIGRRSEKLNTLKSAHPGRVSVVAVDIATEEGRNYIVTELSSFPKIDYLIHAAATIKPLVKIKDLSLQGWRHAIQTNVESPLFLTQLLLHKCDHSRVLFFSSETPVKAVIGASTYCISKAGLQLVYDSFKAEVPSEKAVFAMISPGLVDTPMQEEIRQTDPVVLPAATELSLLYRENKLLPVSIVSGFVRWVLLDVSDEEFSSAIWNIYDTSHQSRWM